MSSRSSGRFVLPQSLRPCSRRSPLPPYGSESLFVLYGSRCPPIVGGQRTILLSRGSSASSRSIMTPLPSRNVLGGPLHLCSQAPLTGFFRNGRCDTCAEDQGCHTVCVEVTTDFLAYSQRAGNNLSTPRPEFGFPGLKAGDRWCVCAAHWLEALEDGVASPVVLAATHERTLEIVPVVTLREHATS